MYVDIGDIALEVSLDWVRRITGEFVVLRNYLLGRKPKFLLMHYRSQVLLCALPIFVRICVRSEVCERRSSYPSTSGLSLSSF